MYETLSLPGVLTGTIVGVDEQGRALVRCAEHGPEARPARVVWMATSPDWSNCVGHRVVLGYEGGEIGSPIILGLLDAPPAARPAERQDDLRDVVRFRSNEELVLECGKAKIALRADGKISIRGGYVVSRSSGVNKIKGGSVQIN